LGTARADANPAISLHLADVVGGGGRDMVEFYFRLFPGAIRSPQNMVFSSLCYGTYPGNFSSSWTDCLRTVAVQCGSLFANRKLGWLEFLPAYAPELTPVECLCSHWKQHELPNFCPSNFGQLSSHAPCVYVACDVGQFWFAPFGNRKSYFRCTYIM
jgi:hypothetical protein